MNEYKNVNPHTIYALVHNHTVYVGKTKGKLDAVYYRHCRSENPYTSAYYFPKNSKQPSMHIVKEPFFDSANTNRHIEAWIYIFRRMGYHVLNTETVPENPENLRPEMKALIRTISPFSMDRFLQETRYVMPTRKPTAKNPFGRKQRGEKLTLWVSPEEKERYVEFAKSLGFTQSEAMQYLISKVNLEKENEIVPNWFDDGFTKNREEMYAKKYEAQEYEIHQLKTTIHRYSEGKKQESKR